MRISDGILSRRPRLNGEIIVGVRVNRAWRILSTVLGRRVRLGGEPQDRVSEGLPEAGTCGADEYTVAAGR